jgi:hypothetical protein
LRLATAGSRSKIGSISSQPIALYAAREGHWTGARPHDLAWRGITVVQGGLRISVPSHRPVEARFLNSSYSHLPKHGPLEGRPFVELDDVDASSRGISDGDTVRVWNDRGALTLTARVSKRLQAGVVAVPFGWWGQDHGQPATANSITSDTLTDWGGGVAYSDTLVEVALASDG